MASSAPFRYLFYGHRELLTQDEVKAWRNIQVGLLIEQCEYPAVRELFHSRWLSEDPAVMKLLENGHQAFYESTLKRLQGSTRNCPKCGALCRTSRARLCPACSHHWYS